MKLRVTGRPRKVLGWDCENKPLAYWYDGETTSEITAIGWKWTNQPNVNVLLLRNDGRFEDDSGKALSKEKAYTLFVAELTECFMNDAAAGCLEFEAY